MASSSQEKQETSEIEKVKQETSEKENMQTDVSQSLLNVIHIRTEVPPRLKRVEAKLLKCEESQAENITILPSSATKKVTSRFSLSKPLSEKLNLPEEMSSQSKELLTRVEELSKNQAGVKKAMSELFKKK